MCKIDKETMTSDKTDEYAFFGKLTKHEKQIVDTLKKDGLSNVEIAKLLSEY